MKKRRASSAKKAGKKAGGRRKKPIMRHSREGAKARAKKQTRKAKAKPAGKRAKKPAARSKKPAKASVKPPAKPKAVARAKPAASRPSPAQRRGGLGPRILERTRLPFDEAIPGLRERSAGPGSAGQSGDIEGLSRAEAADSESVEELIEEGQSFEAGIVDGVENAPDADEGEIETREVPEDDVPAEYRDRDE